MLERSSLSTATASTMSVLVERDRNGSYVASMPSLKGCHTQARSLDELMERIREAAELCLEVQGEDVYHRR